MRQKDLYAELNHPYYVYAPPYTEASGGIRAMHYFCHALNLLGEEAYIMTDVVSNKLRTPILTSHIQTQHIQTNREPIAIYPEIVDGNPLGLKNVVRYLLNLPGRINKKPIKWLSTDQVFTFAEDILPPNTTAPLIQIPLIDRSIYKQNNEKPKVVACHAGLECGILGTNYPDMDMISFGPTIQGAHSPDERASIKSSQKFWKFVLEILENIPVK